MLHLLTFKKLADRKKEITEEDLFILLTDQQVRTIQKQRFMNWIKCKCNMKKLIFHQQLFQ